MKIVVAGSGSSGNCYAIRTDHDYLLIECGVRAKEMLKAVDFQTSRISGCIVSHEHADHMRFFREYQKYGVKVYSSEQVKNDSSIIGMTRMKQTKIGSFTVVPFQVPHNGTECDGFYIRHPDGNIAFMTDLEYLPFDMSELGINHLMIECNYKAEYVDRDEHNADHVFLGHMELEACKRTISTFNTKYLKNIGLIHLSEFNADANEFREEVQRIYPKCYVWVASGGVQVDLSEVT